MKETIYITGIASLILLISSNGDIGTLLIFSFFYILYLGLSALYTISILTKYYANSKNTFNYLNAINIWYLLIYMYSNSFIANHYGAPLTIFILIISNSIFQYKKQQS